MPSAGWVWVAKVCRPSGEAGGSALISSSTMGRMPSSASITRGGLRRCGICTSTMYRRWKARSSASALAYWLDRKAASSSRSPREIEASAATFSPAASIDVPAHGSRAKLSSTQ